MFSFNEWNLRTTDKRTNPPRARVDLAELNPLLRTNPDEFSRTRAKCLYDFGYSDEVSAECCDRVASYLPSMPRPLRRTRWKNCCYSVHFPWPLGCELFDLLFVLGFLSRCRFLARSNSNCRDVSSAGSIRCLRWEGFQQSDYCRERRMDSRLSSPNRNRSG